MFAGGYLVSELRLTIPEAKGILALLDGWIKRHIVSRAGFPCLTRPHGEPSSDYEIVIRSSVDGKRPLTYGCSIRHIQSSTERQEGGFRVVEDRYILTEITAVGKEVGLRPTAVRLFMISEVAQWFAGRMGVTKGRG